MTPRGDGLGEEVFGVAAARDEEGAQGDREEARLFASSGRRVLCDFGGRCCAEDGDGDGVVEDEGRRVIKLMRGAAHSYAEGGSRWRRFLHGSFRLWMFAAVR